MKKFIPYIFITAFIGAFLTLSFVGPFSGTIAGPKVAEAQQVVQDTVDTTTQQNTANTTTKKEDVPWWKDLLNGTLVASKMATGYGTYWGKGSMTDLSIGHIISSILSFFFFVTAKLLALSAILLDKIIQFTVVDFKVNIEHIGVIKAGYKIVLNVANMLFIFILLYIAIKTILGTGGDVKKLLTNVIVVALLINFSLFMTKIAIDASNILSLGFLNSIKTVSETKNGKDMPPLTGSIASSWMSGLKLQTAAYNPDAEIVTMDAGKNLDYYSMSMNFIGASVLNLVTAFVFFAVSLLFITRFIALLFYMLFSPVAFLGIISPEMKEHSSKWWKGLQNQLIFAPAFLFIAYLISAIINSEVLMPYDAKNTFYTAIQSSFQLGFPIVMNYVILIALMIGGLITAKAMASQGSAGMVGYADKFRGWAQGAVGRNTFGRAAYLASKSEFVNNLAAKSPTFGGFAKTRLDSIADAKFGKDNKKGYSQTLKENIEKKKKMADSIAKSKTRGVDKLIKEDQSLIDERAVSQHNLRNGLLESQKKVDDKKSEHELYSKLLENVEDLTKEYAKLSAISSRVGATPEQIATTASANTKLGDENRRLVNERVKLAVQGVNLNRYEAELENAKLEAKRNEAMLDNHEQDTTKIASRLKNLTGQRESIRNKMKTEYMKNLPFAEFGKSLWGDNLGFLDNIFPSYTNAADEIRKGKTKDEKAVLDLIREIAEENKEKK